MRALANHRGFTLLELLVAVGITAVLAAVMLTVTSSTLGMWGRAQGGFTADAEAMLVLDYLERDLEAAIFRPGGGAWLAVDIIEDPATLRNHGWITGATTKPSGPESMDTVPPALDGGGPVIVGSRFGLSGAWLRFITTNVESGASLPVAVSYQIARRPVAGTVAVSNPASLRYGLFRSVVSSATTFTAGYNVLSGYGSTGLRPPVQRAAGTLTNPHTSDLIATNVVDFGVWLHGRDASGNLQRIFPATRSAVSHAASTEETFPVVVDVMVRILTAEGTRLVEGIESAGGALVRPREHASDAAWWWAIVEAHSRVYVRRIQIGGGGR